MAGTPSPRPDSLVPMSCARRRYCGVLSFLVADVAALNRERFISASSRFELISSILAKRPRQRGRPSGVLLPKLLANAVIQETLYRAPP